jgi:signal transduction histidine kinase
LQVIDTGIGIPLEKQEKIFERFYQVENGREGSGIGLSLVQRLVELHHGRIILQSEVGNGLCSGSAHAGRSCDYTYHRIFPCWSRKRYGQHHRKRC